MKRKIMHREVGGNDGVDMVKLTPKRVYVATLGGRTVIWEKTKEDEEAFERENWEYFVNLYNEMRMTL